MILLLGALDEEIAELLAASRVVERAAWHGFTFHRAELKAHAVVIAKTGVGKSMSAMLTQHLIDRYEPSALVFTGIAGALTASIDVGDLLVARDCLQYDLDARAAGFELGQVPFTSRRVFACSPQLLEIARGFAPDDYRVAFGRILTADLFLARADRSSYRYLVDELKGDAVEMEGASVGLVAQVNELPFLLARVISDRADGNAPTSFARLLPIAARRTRAFVEHLLEHLPQSFAERSDSRPSGSP